MEKIIRQMNDWADHEVSLATREAIKASKYNGNSPEAIFRALIVASECYNKMLESGVVNSVRNILNYLLDEIPLTPIQDEEDGWCAVIPLEAGGGEALYRCKRRLSLFKKVTKNENGETIAYSDIERCICIDVKTKEYFVWPFANKILDEEEPIKFPYWPKEKISIYVERLTESDTYTCAIWAFEYGKTGPIAIRRFFKKGSDGKMEEITFYEYAERKGIVNYQNKIKE